MMEIIDFLVSAFQDYTLRIVILGSGILGLTAGILGCFALLRQQSLLGDAISHASLPGIACMFLLTQSKSPYILLSGGALAGGIGILLVLLITMQTTIKKDTALGVILSVFFGFGLVLLTFIQKHAMAHQAVLNKFLFGNASTLLWEDVTLMGIISVFVLICLALFWKEFKLISFDPIFAKTHGYSVVMLDVFLTILLVLSIVIGLQTVGIVLMSTMFIAPAAAAFQWTDRFGVMIFLAGFFGALAGVGGAFLSSVGEHMPTGPTIVVVMSGIVMVSLFFAPHRGIAWHCKLRYRIKGYYE